MSRQHLIMQHPPQHPINPKPSNRTPTTIIAMAMVSKISDNDSPSLFCTCSSKSEKKKKWNIYWLIWWCILHQCQLQTYRKPTFLCSYKHSYSTFQSIASKFPCLVCFIELFSISGSKLALIWKNVLGTQTNCIKT